MFPLYLKEMMNSQNWVIPNYDFVEFSEKKNNYCVCIPVINEGNNIINQLKIMKEQRIFKVADIIICDGGSTDGSLDGSMLSENDVSYLLTKKDLGKLSAQLRMGYSFALLKGYEGIITIDGNGKDNIKSIPIFIDQLEKGYDFIQGSRYIAGGLAINTPKLRHIAVKLIHIPFISFASGFKYTDTTNGFRGYSKRLLLDENVAPFRKIFNTYELIQYLSVRAPKLGFRIKEIPVERKYPNKGKIPTKISLFRGNFLLLRILWGCIFGKYNPKIKRNNY
jgi:dolichol-phosphate mannosyltransferase